MRKKNIKNSWKPEYKYETVSGQFEDYRGNKRDYTMVAVSVPVENDDVVVTYPVEYEDEYEIPGKNVLNPVTGQIEYVPATTESYTDSYDEVLSPISKMLTIGVAVRCVRDEDKGSELATRIAYGKAITLKNHVLFVSHSGMVNTKMVKALLEQEAEFFEKNPGSYLAGYEADMARFKKDGKIADAEMTEEELKRKRVNKNLASAINDIQQNSKKLSIRDKILNEAHAHEVIKK